MTRRHKLLMQWIEDEPTPAYFCHLLFNVDGFLVAKIWPGLNPKHVFHWQHTEINGPVHMGEAATVDLCKAAVNSLLLSSGYSFIPERLVVMK